MKKSQNVRSRVQWLIVFLAMIVIMTVISYYFSIHYKSVLAQERELLGGIVKHLELNLSGRLTALQFVAADTEPKKLDQKEMNQDLIKTVEILKFFNARIFDRQGKIIAEAWPSFNTAEVQDRESFNQVLEGSLIISDVIVSEKYQRPYISLRVPVHRENKQVEAVLAGGILLDDLAGLVEMELLPLCHYIFIKDNNNRTVYYPHPQEGAVQSRFFRDMQIDFQQKPRGVISDKSVEDDEDLIYIYDTLKNSNWQVVMVVPLNQLYVAAFWHPGFYLATLCLALLCIALGYKNLKQARYFEENIEQLRMERLISVNQLAAGLAHEIRNPLTVIKGFMQLIARKKDQTPEAEYIAIILKEIDGMDRLLNEFQLLTLPVKKTDFHRVDIKELIHHVIILMNGQAMNKNIAVKFRHNTDVLISKYLDVMDGMVHFPEDYVLGDQAQLKQVLINLMKNAIDAVPLNGKVDILLSKHDEMIWITVKDNGVGMSYVVLEKIGTPFFTTKEWGNGVGLSLCYKIVESHGGRIEVDSEEGEGSTFIVMLPCIEGIAVKKGI